MEFEVGSCYEWQHGTIDIFNRIVWGNQNNSPIRVIRIVQIFGDKAIIYIEQPLVHCKYQGGGFWEQLETSPLFAIRIEKGFEDDGQPCNIIRLHNEICSSKRKVA